METTREQVIDDLYSSGFTKEQLDMIVKALEPTTKNDLGVDCISRKAVFEAIDDCNRDGLKGIFCSYDDGERFKEYIMDLPLVTPQLSSGLEKNSKELEKNFGESDCVSRERVLKLMYDYKENHSNDREHYPINYGTLLDMIRWVRELPSVTPQEPKTGHWISHREHCENLGVMPSGLSAYEWCSNCDCGIDVREWYRNHYNYCPNCGAKMTDKEQG